MTQQKHNQLVNPFFEQEKVVGAKFESRFIGCDNSTKISITNVISSTTVKGVQANRTVKILFIEIKRFRMHYHLESKPALAYFRTRFIPVCGFYC